MECICCGTTLKSEILFHAKNIEAFGNIVRCPQCRLVSVCPLPSDQVIFQVYQGLYSNREKFDGIDQQKLERAKFSFKEYDKEIRRINQERGRKFLDVGGGMGYYSKAAELQGMESTLLDLDHQSVTFANKQLEISHAYQTNIENFQEKTSEQFDVVFIRHLIEHYKNPATLINAASKLLSKDGVIILETPNSNSIQAFLRLKTGAFFVKKLKRINHDISLFNLIRKRIYAIRPPIHLFSFNKTNLSLLLSKNKLKVAKGLTYQLGDKTYWPNYSNPTFRQMISNIVRMRWKIGGPMILDFGMKLMTRLFLRNNFSGICLYITGMENQDKEKELYHKGEKSDA